jgi:hypothetical protein
MVYKPTKHEPTTKFNIFHTLHAVLVRGYALHTCGRVVVKALCYKPEGRGFDTRRGQFLNLSNPSGRTRPWDLLSL